MRRAGHSKGDEMFGSGSLVKFTDQIVALISDTGFSMMVLFAYSHVVKLKVVIDRCWWSEPCWKFPFEPWSDLTSEPGPWFAKKAGDRGSK